MLMVGKFIVGAKDLIGRAKQLLGSDEERERAVLQATEGLLLYRQGNSVDGASHYTACILKARELKIEQVVQLAYLHFCYEELRIGHAPPFWSIEELQKVFSGDDVSKHAKIVFNRMVQPMLIARQKYGLVDAGYSAPLPMLAPPSA
jgi:hypothetical protein